MVTLKKIKIRKIESSIIKGNFGDGKYFGYKKEKLIVEGKKSKIFKEVSKAFSDADLVDVRMKDE